MFQAFFCELLAASLDLILLVVFLYPCGYG